MKQKLRCMEEIVTGKRGRTSARNGTKKSKRNKNEQGVKEDGDEGEC